MSLTDLLTYFRRKNLGYQTPWLQLTVVYAIALDGTNPEQTFRLRGCLMSAAALEVDFMTQGAFVAYYAGDAQGLAKGNALAELLRTIGNETTINAFGVAVNQGECLAQMSESGRLATRPSGKAIYQAREMAIAAANPSA